MRMVEVDIQPGQRWVSDAEPELGLDGAAKATAHEAGLDRARAGAPVAIDNVAVVAHFGAVDDKVPTLGRALRLRVAEQARNAHTPASPAHARRGFCTCVHIYLNIHTPPSSRLRAQHALSMPSLAQTQAREIRPK